MNGAFTLYCENQPSSKLTLTINMSKSFISVRTNIFHYISLNKNLFIVLPSSQYIGEAIKELLKKSTFKKSYVLNCPNI